MATVSTTRKKKETPSVETPSVETPPVETPPVETPPVETPPVGTPSMEITLKLDVSDRLMAVLQDLSVAYAHMRIIPSKDLSTGNPIADTLVQALSPSGSAVVTSGDTPIDLEQLREECNKKFAKNGNDIAPINALIREYAPDGQLANVEAAKRPEFLSRLISL